ncbi:alanine/glycine:cation symporter family protein [Cloacibacillus evryensis]|uniref:alanine/glycine:cation symporter family protein n=1 Tax=Cloacibacillus evryensis TaxID=508460 RepID=UPI003A858031
MEQLTQLVTDINSFIWGLWCLIPLLCGTGLYFTIRLKFVQIRKFPEAFKAVFGGINLFGKRAGKDGMSSFQALTTAIAGQVGTGNLAGAATAIAMGGPGAIFWMWVAAFLGMATIFAEATLAQVFKHKEPDGRVVGGPAFYIMNGLHCKPLAVFFSVSLIIALGFIGNAVQTNSIADACNVAFGWNKLYVGIFLAALGAYVFFGGIGRIAAITEKLVPVMAAMYLIGGAIILIMNFTQLPHAFWMIFKGAFNPAAATGGLIGVSIKQAVRYGVARGLFSNEAGMGSTPHAHAVAKVNHPCEQGYAAIISVFIDTFCVLNMTAFVIFVTGAIDGHTSGIALTQKAFSIGLGQLGVPFVALCLFFFAFSTVIGWYFYGEQNIIVLCGEKGLLPYRLIVVIFLVLGSVLQLDLAWQLADFFNGIMVFPNLVALLGLASIVSKQLNEYEKDGRLKAAK